MTSEVPLDERWRLDAACRGSLVEKFFPDSNVPQQLKTIRSIQNICKGCSVRVECFDYSQVQKERYGIWGGATHSWRQRKRSTANTTKEEMRTDISMAVDDIAYEMASQYVPEPCVENDGREYVAFLFPALRALALV